MIVLGIDPGLARFGYGIIARTEGALHFRDAGVVTTSPRTAVSERLAVLLDATEGLVSHTKPDRIILERVFPTAQASLHRIGEVRGIVLALAGRKKIPVEEISPTALKALMVRSGQAKKMQVRKTVQRILALKGLPPADAADALALAILGSGGNTKMSTGRY